LTLSLIFLATCSSGTQRIDSDKDITSDSGGLTRMELEKAAVRIAQKISVYFKKNPAPKGVFVALLATKNETSEQIPVEIFDDALVKELLRNKIVTLRTDKRQDQLKEVKIDQLLGTDNIDVGKLKSPNYFVKARIDENAFRSDGDKIVEQIMSVEFIEVASLGVMVSEKEVYRKKPVDNKGLGW
jgi:hypothetical protein